MSRHAALTVSQTDAVPLAAFCARRHVMVWDLSFHCAERSLRVFQASHYCFSSQPLPPEDTASALPGSRQSRRAEDMRSLRLHILPPSSERCCCWRRRGKARGFSREMMRQEAREKRVFYKHAVTATRRHEEGGGENAFSFSAHSFARCVAVRTGIYTSLYIHNTKERDRAVSAMSLPSEIYRDISMSKIFP